MNIEPELSTKRPDFTHSAKSKRLEAFLREKMQELDCNFEFPDYLKSLPGVIEEKTIRSKPAGKPVARLNFIEIIDEDADQMTVLFDSSDGIPHQLYVIAMPLQEVSWRYDYEAQKLI